MHHTKHNRIAKFVAAAATAAVAGALVVVGAPMASAAPRTIAVSGEITGFTPKTINVEAGEAVSICLTSPDTDHDLTISDIGFKVVAPKGPAVCKTLTAPAAAGSHPFICSVPGHDALMKGTLVVAAAGGATTPSASPSASATPQVGSTPAGGVQTGGGSTAGFDNAGLVTLGGGLLLAAFMSAMLGWRVARRD